MSFAGIRNAIRQLLGKTDADFAHALIAQLDACLEGAVLVHRISQGEVGPENARLRMSEIEHEGDRRRGDLVEALARTVVTPIDREDLFRVSRSIDDVLDNLRDYAREVDLLQATEETSEWADLTAAIIDTVDGLRAAVADLADSPDRLYGSLLAAKKSCNDVRQLYQKSIANLLSREKDDHQESPRSIMRRRELLRRLDIVGLRMGEAADALADGLMKRSI